MHDLLTNPAYAGAFVFGRTRTEKRVEPDGRLVVRTRQLPVDEWEVLICDHHPGYVSWETWQATQDRLRRNWRPPRGHGGGAPREGRALLQGLLRCGRCGRIMQTGYSGPAGNSPRYLCGRAKQLYAAEHGCQSIGGGRVEKTVLQHLFAVLEPAALAATAAALAQADAAYQDRLRVFETTVERARFEANRAIHECAGRRPRPNGGRSCRVADHSTCRSLALGTCAGDLPATQRRTDGRCVLPTVNIQSQGKINAVDAASKGRRRPSSGRTATGHRDPWSPLALL